MIFNQTKKSISFLQLSLALGLLFLLSCSSGGKKKPANTITIVTLRGPSAISMIKMIDSPKMDKHIELQFIIKDDPNQVKPYLVRGEADFAVLPSTMAAVLYNQGLPYQLTSIPLWGTLHLFGSDTTIHSWQDLKGTRVYSMARGMTPDIVFRYLLNAHGLQPDKDVTLDYSFPTHRDLANAVAAGRASLGVISEPLVSMVISRNPKVHEIFDLDKEWNKATHDSIPFAQTALIVNKKFAESNPDKVMAFLDFYKEACQWINTHPAKGSKLIVTSRILPDTLVARKSIPGCNIRFANAWPVRNQINDYFNVFYTFNPDMLGGKLPDEEFYYQVK
ncbi:MAG TPA: ABC transporter substrate-binding protein [Bacteroidales bacterium]|nr:ABC transporter substrate-binding protein [Bacteroidales bacterium]